MLLHFQRENLSLPSSQIFSKALKLCVILFHSCREYLELISIVLHHVVYVVLELCSISFQDIEFVLQLHVLGPRYFIFLPFLEY
jgi:hypothetical protein